MPRKRSAVGVVDGTTSVSSSASTDFVAPGGGSRADLEHLASTLGLSVDACLAIMNCEGQVRHFILLVSSYHLHALPGYFGSLLLFFMRIILFIIYIISFLIVVLQNNLYKYRASHQRADDGVLPAVYPLDYPQSIQQWRVYGVIL